MPPAILDGDASRASCLRRASEQELVEVVDPSSPPSPTRVKGALPQVCAVEDRAVEDRAVRDRVVEE